jgi:hypothetical protein
MKAIKKNKIINKNHLMLWMIWCKQELKIMDIYIVLMINLKKIKIIQNLILFRNLKVHNYNNYNNNINDTHYIFSKLYLSIY